MSELTTPMAIHLAKHARHTIMPGLEAIIVSEVELQAVEAQARSNSLDAAWAEAEAAREGWVVQGLHAFVEGTSERGIITGWEAQAMDSAARFSERGEGPTPAAALRALAAKLRETPR